MSPRFSRAELLHRACLRVAFHMRSLWEEKGSSDTRLLESFFIPDELTLAGRSRRWDGKGRREHVIPRRMLTVRCHEMLAEGATDAEIAEFIAQHILIVQISAEEQARLDNRAGLNLRQRMPDGWTFGDDPYARLTAAGIEWDPIPEEA